MAHPRELTCAQDDPAFARVFARKECFKSWARPLALAPFVVVVIVSLKLFPDADTLFFVLMMAATVWAVSMLGYTEYLIFFALRCPRCRNRFGISNHCRHCDLPLRRQSPADFSLGEYIENE
jgi:predicted membrane channel-forming protein YqfA (hemolysin III family)